MMKSINVSTKITILILSVSLVAVAAISFFSYDYQVKNNREKYATILTALAENRASLLTNYLARAGGAVQLLQQADMLKNGSSGAAPGGMDMAWTWAALLQTQLWLKTLQAQVHRQLPDPQTIPLKDF